MVGLRHFDPSNVSALVKSLAKIPLPRRGTARSKSDPRVPVPRVDVVSESLCDDVIRYLAPTLEQHKGCTVIDLQPGACLFSSKLHEFLKPKWHLLIEPEDHYYKPFIQPLLDRPASTYRYTQLNILHQSSYWTEFERIKRDPLLLPQDARQLPHDDAKRQLNPNILMIGNLAREGRSRPNSHSIEQAPLLLHELSLHVLAKQYFQDAGLLRMLYWLPEVYKPSIFALLPWLRNGFNGVLDMGLNISEAVSVQSLASLAQSRSSKYVRRSRATSLDAAVDREVSKRMRKAGMAMPATRDLKGPARDAPNLQRGKPHLSPLRQTLKSIHQLREAIDKARSRIEGIQTQIRASHLVDESVIAGLAYPQVTQAVDEYGVRKTDKSQNLSWWRAKYLVDIGLSLIHIEANFKRLEETSSPSPEIDDLRGAILGLDKLYADVCGKSAVRTQAAVLELLEDQVSFFVTPRLLNYDQRRYEPLQADASEFFPQQSLALLDLMPKGKDLSVPGLASESEATRFCAELMQAIFASKMKSLPQALDTIGVNAANDLMPMVPAITDARRGGRLNPYSLRARMVTPEMIEGLVKAYFEWPFRPPSWEVALTNMTSAGPDDNPDGDDADLSVPGKRVGQIHDGVRQTA